MMVEDGRDGWATLRTQVELVWAEPPVCDVSVFSFLTRLALVCFEQEQVN